jgi:hypothetical protein
MQNIQFVNPLEIHDWDTQILQFPGATIFHSSAWARVLIESYGFVPHYCIVNQAEEITGVLPLMEVSDVLGRKKMVSLPFSDFCEPLFHDSQDVQKVCEHLTVTAQNKKWRSLELRGGHNLLADKIIYDELFSHEIDLDRKPEELLQSFSDTTRRNIRKAEKAGITVTHENSLDAMNRFYGLNCQTRRKHGLPPQPWKFFCKLHESFFTNKKGFVTLGVFQGKVIAGNLFLTSGHKALYKYGASDHHFQHLRASNLVMWEGIKHCRESGCLGLHLGRTELHHTGLRQFKLGWTRNETTNRYYRYHFLQKRYLKKSVSLTEGLPAMIFRNLPQPILKIIGTVLYKYIA